MSEIRKTVLAIFSHPDDELGVAGTLANHAENGDDVHLVFLTKGENASTITGSQEEIKQKREEHTKQIAEILGVKVRLLDFPDSHIEYNVVNGYKIAEIIKEIRPNVLITWTKFERPGGGHPDHRNTADLVRDAISYARYKNNNSEFEPYRESFSFYTYLNLNSRTSAQIKFVDVTTQKDKIEKFIAIYRTAYGDWPVENFKFGSLGYFGRQAGVKYAEAFEQITKGSPTSNLLD